MNRTIRTVLPLLLFVAACPTKDNGPQTGSLEVVVAGLPGAPALITVTGPAGYSVTVQATTTLLSLAPGAYTVTALDVVAAGATYTPTPTNATIDVPASNTASSTSVSYALVSGALSLTVTGLPTGVNASVAVTGPAGFSQTMMGTQTLTNVPAGAYTVTANIVAQGSTTYGGTPPSQSVTVPASATPATAAVAYSAMTGQLAVTVTGTPAGVNPSVTVTGPFAYSHSITTTGVTTLTPLPLGTYTVSALNVANATAVYAPPVASQDVLVNSGALNGTATVAYAVATGSLTVTISGLPTGVNAAATVTGPSGFTQNLTATTTINKLVPGSYTITATSVASGGVTYGASPQTQSKMVAASLTATTAAVVYGTLDLSIAGLYITQATQSATGTVPLVRGRAGYLRVFAIANGTNTVAPRVRVRWYSSGSLIRTDTIAAPTPSAPLAPNEGLLTSSWNLPVPASLIQPNLSILADVDPGALIAEADETNNSYPTNGTPLLLDVRTANPHTVTLVPVRTTANSATGNVTAANKDSYLAFTQKIHPIPGFTTTLHATYSTMNSTDTLQSDDANRMWETVLSEVTTLRAVESAPASQYYYGVVHPTYSSGTAGLGWIGGTTAIGWDRAVVDQILAHETGHNWGRNHSPGCGAANADPSYPLSSGGIDEYGLDVATLIPYSPTPVATYDIMSYCRPQWTSGFTYTGVLNYRASTPVIVAAAAAAAAAPEPVLLVWGRMHSGALVLEPAFEVTAAPRLPQAGGGAYTLEGLDAGGTVLFSYAFDGDEAADAPTASRGFAFAIPLARFDITRLSSLRLAGQGLEAVRGGGPAVAAMRTGATPSAAFLARAAGAGAAQLTWDAASYPMAMVRDAITGEVLSFARGGSASIAAPNANLEVVLSDGVRSVTTRVRVQ